MPTQAKLPGGGFRSEVQQFLSGDLWGLIKMNFPRSQIAKALLGAMIEHGLNSLEVNGERELKT